LAPNSSAPPLPDEPPRPRSSIPLDAGATAGPDMSPTSPGFRFRRELPVEGNTGPPAATLSEWDQGEFCRIFWTSLSLHSVNGLDCQKSAAQIQTAMMNNSRKGTAFFTKTQYINSA
jgi:hypothetical protein